MKLPGGETKLAAVIGDPVRHSLSPLIHNTAFELLGLDWVFLAFEISRGSSQAALDAMRSLGIEGLSVTMPLKSEIFKGLDRVSSIAQRLESVNVVHRLGNDLVGDSTDGQGFINALRYDQNFDPQGKRCVVFGAGGAARAVILALAEAGATDLAIVARRENQAQAAAGLIASVGRVGTPKDVTGADLVVNATPIGMKIDSSVLDISGPDVPFDPELVGAGQLVCDLIYHPLETPLLVQAASKGAQVSNGVGMLIHQAALSFKLWTGESAPVEEMYAALKLALHPKSQS